MEDAMACGEELATSAAIPEQFGELFVHVAANLRDHAAWVGRESENARREHDALLGVARGYEEIHAVAVRTAERMRSLAGLPANPHDPAKLDRAAFADWMKKKVALQRSLAAMLIEHAEQSERVLGQLARESDDRRKKD